MSKAAWDWARSLKLDRSAKAVLLALANHARKGECFPSHRTIATEIGCSVDTVQRALKRLYQAGVVERDDRYDKRGRRTSNTYRLKMQAPPQNAGNGPPAECGGVPLQNAGDGQPQNAPLPSPAKCPPTQPQFAGEHLTIDPINEPRRRKKEKKEPPTSKPKTAPAKRYAFDGVVIRLNEADYERWRKLFHFLPDFEVELQRADGYYASREGGRHNWFHRVSRWLAKANEEARQDDWHTYAGLDFSTPEAKQRWYAQHEVAKRLVADFQVAA